MHAPPAGPFDSSLGCIVSQVAAHGEEGGKFLFTFQDPLRKLSHGNDGIIFTPVLNPYEPGTCQSLYFSP